MSSIFGARTIAELNRDRIIEANIDYLMCLHFAYIAQKDHEEIIVQYINRLQYLIVTWLKLLIINLKLLSKQVTAT